MGSPELLPQEWAAIQEEMAQTSYSVKKPLGAGGYGIAYLLQHKVTNELVAGKLIPRGQQIDVAVEREILNHRMLLHPHVIRFREALVTPRSLCIILDYATAGELFQYVKKWGRLSESHARYFFQQLVSGVSFCHEKGISHRDLKLENALIHYSYPDPPLLKLCDFGFSKHSEKDSQPKSVKGTVEYLAPEVVFCNYNRVYDGRSSDVWSCGVILYLMLCGCYPFEDSVGSVDGAVDRIVNVQYTFPEGLTLSEGCRDIIRRIFVKRVAERITLPEIKQHSWFLTQLPSELQEHHVDLQVASSQSEDDIRQIVAASREPPAGSVGQQRIGRQGGV